jgi:hypothetical protein
MVFEKANFKPFLSDVWGLRWFSVILKQVFFK